MTHRHRWLIGTVVVLTLAAALALIAGGGQRSLAQGDIIYVDADAPGPTHDGSTWDFAYTTLQPALADAEAGDHIWVAAGTYKPTDGDDRTASFHLVNGVAIYGGFAGGEATLEDRDWVNNVTTLSGDIGAEDDESDNVYHVLMGIEITEPVVLDGLTIAGGYAQDTTNYDDRFGGGLFAYAAELRLENLRVEGNTAEEWGGGVYINGSNATLVNVVFGGNSAYKGGGLCVNNSEAALTNCTFSTNSATLGGVLFNSDSSPTLTNCILWGDDGPEILNAGTSAPAITYSDIQGGYEGEGNIDETPLFVDPGSGDFHLEPDSPCIDAGDNSAPGLAGITTDLGGNPRFAGVVDMGAYEAPHNPLFVDLDAIGANDGTSWEDALTDLQVALAWAQDGVEIWVAAGTYKPTWRFDVGDPRSATFQMVNGVAICGGFDPSAGDTGWDDRDWVANPTILSGDIGLEDDPDDNCYHVFYHHRNLGSSAILDGFTISGGNAAGDYPHYRGGGMYNYESSPTLTNCTFEDNSASLDAGGMLNWVDSSPTLTNCTFKGNSSSQFGGGMHNIASAPTLTDLVFIDNSARFGGGLYNHYSSPVLTNVAFISNEATWGGGMYDYYSAAMLTNCTFSGNTATYGGGLHNSHSTPVLTNCILWGDTAGGLPSEISGDPVTATYSDIQGGYGGEGNIDTDPLFVDPGSGDVHLGPGSPCIDAGSNSAPNLPETDFEGDPRILDGDGDGDPIVDMGVDEVRVYYVDADAASGAQDGTSWEDAFTTLQPALDIATAGKQIWVAAGTYTPAAEYGGSGDRYRSFQLLNGVALYGGFDPSLGDVAWEDRDWESNPTTLSGDLSGDDGPGLANNSDNCYHVFYHPPELALDGTAVLDGFTITGGNANHPSDTAFRIGGGMLNTLSSPSLLNCTFSDNASVAEGAGVYNWTSSPLLYNCTLSGNSSGTSGGGMNNTLSEPTLVHCLFSGNSAASEGGGMRNFTDSSPALTNCTFDGNTAGTNGGGMANVSTSSPTLLNSTFAGNSAAGDGGGLYNAGLSSPVLTNCTFWGNSANYGGGIYNIYDSSPTLTNCILWADTAGGLPNEITNDDSAPVVTFSNVQGGYPGTGNLDLHPGLVDPHSGDFHLHPCSPCIDAGTNAAPFLPAHDFEGDPRIVDGNGDTTATADMGMDELAAPGTCLQIYLPLVLRNY